MTYEEVKAIRNNPTAEACDIEELQRLIDIALEKQIPKPPVEKVHPEYPALGKMYFCECGVLFPGWGNPKAETNYCGNCGRRLKGEE
jgi:hypothetical protein